MTYPVGFYFRVSFDGKVTAGDVGFQEISGISKEISIEEVTGGGENRFKYRLPTVATSQNLVLKRALVPKGSKLVAWCSKTIDDGLANKIETHNVSVSLLDSESKVYMTWTFYNAYPIKYAISDLRSQENNLVIESIELVYTFFRIAQDS